MLRAYHRAPLLQLAGILVSPRTTSGFSLNAVQACALGGEYTFFLFFFFVQDAPCGRPRQRHERRAEKVFCQQTSAHLAMRRAGYLQVSTLTGSSMLFHEELSQTRTHATYNGTTKPVIGRPVLPASSHARSAHPSVTVGRSRAAPNLSCYLLANSTYRSGCAPLFPRRSFT
jgi:hypothetical protein